MKFKSCVTKHGNFEYSHEEINKLIEEYNLCPVSMIGLFNELVDLKTKLEEFYEKNIFYLDYWQSEAPYHGWLWENDDGRMKGTATITEGITEKFLEIYALTLSGLGQKFVDVDDETFDLREVKSLDLAPWIKRNENGKLTL